MTGSSHPWLPKGENETYRWKLSKSVGTRQFLWYFLIIQIRTESVLLASMEPKTIFRCSSMFQVLMVMLALFQQRVITRLATWLKLFDLMTARLSWYCPIKWFERNPVDWEWTAWLNYSDARPAWNGYWDGFSKRGNVRSRFVLSKLGIQDLSPLVGAFVRWIT